MARERVKATPADARVIQRALAPQAPSFPKKIPTVLFATLAGSILSFGVVIAGEMLTGRASASSAAQDPAEPMNPPSGQPVRAEQAREKSRRRSEIGADSYGSESAAPMTRDASRQAVVARALDGGVTVLMAPCAEPGPRVATAISLARTLARQGRALLVVADPGARIFDDLPGPETRLPGMAELSSGAAGFDAVIHRDALSTLHVLPGGAAAGASVGDAEQLVSALAHVYDFVVFRRRPKKLCVSGPIWISPSCSAGEKPRRRSARSSGGSASRRIFSKRPPATMSQLETYGQRSAFNL